MAIGKLVGFYRETHKFLERGNRVLPSITDHMNAAPISLQEEVASYLQKGNESIYIGSIPYVSSQDELNGLHNLGLTLTDGVWIWPWELPYYLMRYNLELPSEFVGHAIANNWMIPQLDSEIEFPGAKP